MVSVSASESVVRVGGVADVLGAADRVVVCLERDGASTEEILVLRLRHGLYAVVNRCPHLGRALEDGRVSGHNLQCRGHGRSYNLRSGRAAGALPGSGRPLLRRVRAWEQDGQLLLDITPLAIPGRRLGPCRLAAEFRQVLLGRHGGVADVIGHPLPGQVGVPGGDRVADLLVFLGGLRELPAERQALDGDLLPESADELGQDR